MSNQISLFGGASPLKIAEIARKHGVCWKYVKDLKNKLEEDENEKTDK